jgi:hypothetical protein
VHIRSRLQPSPLPRPLRVFLGAAVGALGLFETLINIPSIPDELARWSPALDWLQQHVPPLPGEARGALIAGTVLIALWLLLPISKTTTRPALSQEPTQSPRPIPRLARKEDRQPLPRRAVWQPGEFKQFQRDFTDATRPAPLPGAKTTPESEAKLPRRLRGVPVSDRGTWGWRLISTRSALAREGESHKAQLNRLSISAPASDEDGWRNRIGAWEDKVRAFEAEWDWGDADLLLTLFGDAEAKVDPTIVPAPEWRARLQGRIDAGLGWLRDHDVPFDAVGLHTESIA